MKKTMIALFCFFLFAQADDVSGIYVNQPDKNGKRAIIELFQHEGKYYAYGFANEDFSEARKDVHNPDARLRDRLAKGVVFVYGLTKDGDVYKNGKIYNFDNGKTYHLKATPQNKELKLRASIDKTGLMGETLVWKKLDDGEIQKYLPYKPDVSEILPAIPKE